MHVAPEAWKVRMRQHLPRSVERVRVPVVAFHELDVDLRVLGLDVHEFDAASRAPHVEGARQSVVHLGVGELLISDTKGKE